MLVGFFGHVVQYQHQKHEMVSNFLVIHAICTYGHKICIDNEKEKKIKEIHERTKEENKEENEK
jgi:predicted RNase H-related nuclease YkuK (DUF458 family)